MMKRQKATDAQIIDACKRNPTARQAAQEIGLSYNALLPRAKKLGVFYPNPTGINSKIHDEMRARRKTPLQEILEGKHPSFSAWRLKIRLIEEGVLDSKCDVCEIRTWNEKQISLELDHIDGDNTNHKIENLRLLCPNCHSQTDTYRRRNNNMHTTVTDEKLSEALKRCSSIREALLDVGLAAKGANYNRAYQLLSEM